MSEVNNKGRTNNAFVSDESKNDHGSHVKSAQFSLEMSEKDSYDPYQHRKVEHPTTNGETLIHLLKGSLGTGILAMPNAFSHSGYVIGSISTVIIGIICTYCIHLLLKSHYELCKRKKVPSLTYPEIFKAALDDGPSWMKWLSKYIVDITNLFLLIYQLGACCVYVVFIASNIKSIVDYFFGAETDVRMYMVIILLPLVLINWVRNLKLLAPFSAVANIVTIISFAIIGYYIFREPLGVEGRKASGSIKEFPLFFGTVLFALEAIGVIMPLENEMRSPKSFGGYTGVLNRSMLLIIVLYVGMGLFGYLNYGSNALGSITLNLPSDELLAQAVKGMLAFGIFITHGLACYVAIDITWNDYVGKKLGENRNKLLWEYFIRTILVLITFFLAVAIPNLELFISLFGALCLSALGLAFPALVEYCTFYKERDGCNKICMIFKDVIIFVIGVAGLIIGTYTSLTEIIHTYFNGEIHS